MKNLTILANISLGAVSRQEVLDGVTHLVVPAVAIKEGVLNNIYYSASELESFANTWNGVPVPVNHPVSDGNNITANSTLCEDTVNIGRFYNVKFEDGAVKGEIWVNIAKAKKLGYADVLERLVDGEMMEVSTGLFAVTNEEAGEFEGTAYTHTISNIRPDHLALLPTEIGACSVSDGCGAMRTNKKACCNACHNRERDTIWNKFKSIFVKNEKSYDETRTAIYVALTAKLGEGNYAYIVDVYSDWFVYEVKSTLYKQSYLLKDDVCNLVGEPIKVLVERKYVPVSAETVLNTVMNEKKKKALVDALALAMIGNANSVTDDHKKGLNGLTDCMLLNMAKDKGINLDDDGEPVVNTPKTEPKVAPVVSNGLSDEDKQLLANFKAKEAARLEDKRKQLVDTNENLSAEMVANMDEATLDALTPKQAPVSYGVGGAVPATTNTRKKPSIFFDEAKA